MLGLTPSALPHALSSTDNPQSEQAPCVPSAVLTAGLPERWGVLQRAKNTTIYACARVLFVLLGLMPVSMGPFFGRTVGWLAYVFASADRRRALTHLAMAMPEMDGRARQHTVRAMFVHLAQSAYEAAHLAAMFARQWAPRLSPQDRGLLETALGEGKGVVAVTGHIGNWELLAQSLAREGLPVTAIAKPAYDPRLTRWVHALRTSQGMQVLWRGDAGMSREMLKVFHRKEILALLIDQDTRVQGTFVPFFGRPAYTPTAAAALALRVDAPVIVGWTHREGRAHRVYFERVQVTRTGNEEADVTALTAEITLRLERAIRQRPEQWVWMHRRWKTQPPAPLRR